MKLKCETILNCYTLKKRRVVCRIKVNSKSPNFENTCRSLTQEQWMTFDKELEKVLSENDSLINEKRIFVIEPHIEVKVQKSKLPFKHIFKLLDSNCEYNRSDVTVVSEHNLVLECLIKYQIELPSVSSVGLQEYEPQFKISPDAKLCNQLSYEPYTPSLKTLNEDKVDNLKNSGSSFFDCNEDTYSPTPVFEICSAKTLITQTIPKYTPAPINVRFTKEKNKVDSPKEGINKRNSLKKKLSKRSKTKECEYIPKCQEVAIADVPIYIPTPIEDSGRQKEFERDIRKKRKRSNTIDVFPENIGEKQTPKADQLPCEAKCSYMYSKKRSMTIDEIPAALAEIPVYIPTPIEETTHQKCLKTDEIKRNEKRPSSIELPKIDENTKENYVSEKYFIESKKECSSRENKMKKRSMTIDEIPVTLMESSVMPNSSIFHKRKQNDLKRQFCTTKEKNMVSEKNTEKILFLATVKTQTKGSDIKLAAGNKSVKNMQQLDVHSLNTDTYLQKAIEHNNIEGSRTESFRRSEWSPTKPKRLIEEHANLITKNSGKKLKSSPKTKELFGTDDDDDDDDDDNGHFCNGNEVNKIFCETSAGKNVSQAVSLYSLTKEKSKKSVNSENRKKCDMSKRPDKKLRLLDEEVTKALKASSNCL